VICMAFDYDSRAELFMPKQEVRIRFDFEGTKTLVQ